ncbi:MAG TPA: hypothetical protein DCG47_13880 [Spirochaetaceae bacterium]|jgi:hypothetical protein|nr:hypothetical protein [Spirochaetaceae bacterium]
MTKEQWETVSSRVRVILNYGIAQTQWLEESRLARFIAAVPFLARCGKAMETSFTHLLTYLASSDGSVKHIFFHKPEDDEDIYARLSPILNFQGGDEAALQCCKDLLTLSMVVNYQKDAESDQAVGKYNPVNAGIWDAEELIAQLKESIQRSITPEIAEFYTVDEALRGYWLD